MSASMPPVHPLYAAMGTTVFEEMSAVARESGAINLGQGFPGDDGPVELIEAAARALREKSNQYPPIAGLPDLRDSVCRFYRAHQRLGLTREQVIVTSGATEAIACAVMALVRPGDEVILFQPAYDAYAPLVRRCGGVPVSVRLRPPEWRYSEADLRAAITPQTKAVMLNDPLNPAGTVASEADLAMLARVCAEQGLAAICDEVWEHVRFDGARHRSLIDFPGMAERTVKIGSAGKIFGLTGWKIGWMCAAPELAAVLARVHQFVTATTLPPLQWAVAEGLAKPVEWFEERRAQWAQSRARLIGGLESTGFAVLPGAATWFVCVDLAASGIFLDDLAFSRRAVREAGVATIPVSALYDAPDAPRNVVRLCFTKSDAALDEAVARLAAFREALPQS